MPPSGKMVPLGSANNTAGSALGWPWPSINQAAGRWPPSLCKRLVMPLVVAEVDTSTNTGHPEVGKPTETGLGVNTASSPPKGATLAELPSEQCSSIAKPWLVARSWKAARQAMWWLRRITTVQVPWVRARDMATSMACSTSQGPGRRWPSQVRAAGKSDTTKGAPSLRIEPDSISPK